MSPLLITTAIQPPENSYALRMTDTHKRAALTKAAIFFWAGFGIKKIVVADATEKTVLNADDLTNLSTMGVEVEQIQYCQDFRAVIEKGKGYGEGALLDFSIKNSSILRDADHFYKSTGKIFCRNFENIESVLQRNKIENIFWRDSLNEWIDTRFFHVSKSFCSNFLIPAYRKIDDRKGLWAERVVYELVKQKFTPRRSTRPFLTGFSGTEDKPYLEHHLGFLDEKFPCWIG